MSIKKLLVLAISLISITAQAEIKNEQNILGGLLTRAGVKKRLPLSTAELQGLCERGFSQAYALYGGPEKTVTCSRGTIKYIAAKDFRTATDMNRVLENIHSGITNKEKTFVHCNNGAHASGYVAAIALRTFCGTSGERAVSYWDRTLNGYALQEPNRSSLMKRIRNYPVRADLELNEAQKQAYGCPK